MALTLDEVLARSEQVMGTLKTHCYDCHMNFALVEMPCKRHCTDEERVERDRKFGALWSKWT